jgi:hypothetical protein
VDLVLSVTTCSHIYTFDGARAAAVITLTNRDASAVGFAVRLKVMRTDNGGSTHEATMVTGVKYDDNYLTLLPWESHTTRIEFPLSEGVNGNFTTDACTFSVHARGWNTTATVAPLFPLPAH